MDEKLTPGPWKWDLDGTRGYPVLYGGEDGGYAVLGLPGDRSYMNPDSPDARLIAAAPEMLDMLKTIENDGKQVPPWLWEKIQAVIAKAEAKDASEKRT